MVFFDPTTASALDASEIASGRSVGAAAAYKPEVDGKKIGFASRGGEIVDTATGSTWNLLGEATAGELKGSKLQPVEFVPTFWFSWVAFEPDTTIWQGG